MSSILNFTKCRSVWQRPQYFMSMSTSKSLVRTLPMENFSNAASLDFLPTAVVSYEVIFAQEFCRRLASSRVEIERQTAAFVIATKVCWALQNVHIELINWIDNDLRSSNRMCMWTYRLLLLWACKCMETEKTQQTRYDDIRKDRNKKFLAHRRIKYLWLTCIKRDVVCQNECTNGENS